MEMQFTGNLDPKAQDRIRQAIEGAEEIKKMTQKKLGSAVGMKQPAVSQAKKGHLRKWSEKLKNLVLHAEAKIKENAEAMLQEKIAQYLAVGGREKVLSGIFALLTKEQERHQASTVRLAEQAQRSHAKRAKKTKNSAKPTKKTKSRKAASSTR